MAAKCGLIGRVGQTEEVGCSICVTIHPDKGIGSLQSMLVSRNGLRKPAAGDFRHNQQEKQEDQQSEDDKQQVELPMAGRGPGRGERREEVWLLYSPEYLVEGRTYRSATQAPVQEKFSSTVNSVDEASILLRQTSK